MRGEEEAKEGRWGWGGVVWEVKGGSYLGSRSEALL